MLLHRGGGEIKGKPTSFIVTRILFKVNDMILGDENDDVAGKSVESSSDATEACYEASHPQGCCLA